MARSDGRTARDHRPVEVTAGFHRNAEGSVLYRTGRTVVLCTASITGGYIALALALATLKKKGDLTKPVLRDQVAAISVGSIEDSLMLDLVYVEDSRARVDLNLVATGHGAIVEVQGTAEGEAIPRSELDKMIDLGLEGTASLVNLQRSVLSAAGVDLASLIITK